MTWHYSTAGRPAGPITHDELIRLIASGGLGPDDLVRGEGMDTWQTAGGVPGLFSPPEADGVVLFSPAAGAPSSEAHAATTPAVAAAAPAASTPLPGPDDQGFFSLKGRASRHAYALQMMGLFFVWALGVLIMAGIGVPFGWPLVTLACTVSWAFPAARRLHDLDFSGWGALAGYIPVAGLVVGVLLFFMQGTAGPNRYGPEPVAPVDPAA